MNTEQKQALYKFKPALARGVWSLSGNSNRLARQELMSALNGKKTPISASGVTAIEKKIVEILGIDPRGRTMADTENTIAARILFLTDK